MTNLATKNVKSRHGSFFCYIKTYGLDFKYFDGTIIFLKNYFKKFRTVRFTKILI